jgi:dUTP pyrophosphatase
MDLYAVISEPLELAAHERQSIPTGIAVAMPDGYEAQVRPRSGLAWRHGITVLNSPGTIDADYRGEIKVILINHSSESYTIQPYSRIAQLVFAPIIKAQLQLVPSLPNTSRADKGFGSTGGIG